MTAIALASCPAKGELFNLLRISAIDRGHDYADDGAHDWQLDLRETKQKMEQEP